MPFGIGAAIASRSDLRAHLKSAWSTTSFWAAMTFAVFVLVPVGVYFYVFYGDWSLGYAYDVERIPSALAMLTFFFATGIYALSFGIGAWFVRAQYERIGVGLAVGLAVLFVAPNVLVRERLAQVGTFAQYGGGFGLIPWSRSPLVASSLAFLALLTAGYVALVVLLAWRTPKRAASR